MGVDEHATGKENLILYGHFYRLDNKTIKQRVKELFELVDLTGYENRIVSTYSGGMRKRLDIAMGLIHQPRLIFLDEPTTGLDPQTRTHMLDYIRNLAKNMGISIFLTTHYMEEADQLADRIAIIDLGKLMAIDTPEKLKQSIGGDIVMLSSRANTDQEREEFKKRAESALTGKPFVVGIQAADGELAVYVDNDKSAVPAIMGILAGEHIEVQTLSISRPSLDDVFLKYTGHKIRVQEGTPTTFSQMMRKRNRR